MIASDLALKFFETRSGDTDIGTFLKIENQGDRPILRNWRLYFSLGLTPCENTLLKQVLIDGRYGYLEPTDAWQPIQPRASMQVQVENWLFSGMRLLTRQGFFLVELDEHGDEVFLGEPPCLAPELQPLTDIRNPSITAMTPGVRTSENAPPETVDEPHTIIPSPKVTELSETHLHIDTLTTTRMIDASLAKGYELEISDTGISIRAGSETQAFYAEQTLEQLAANGNLPAATVSDHPDFDHRGLFIDIARHFHDSKQLTKIIRAMSCYKLNRLQLGISNDEGWRLEINGLPELTEIGARRGRFGPIYPSWGDGPEEVSGHLTRQEFVELLTFAADHHVTIIPEINVPGHANALLRAFDHSMDWQLTEPEDASSYRSAQDYCCNVVNVGLEDTYRVMEIIISDIQCMFDEAGVPLEFLHLGGDEVPHGAWLHSPACRNLEVWDSAWDMNNPENQNRATAALMGYHYRRMLEIVSKIAPETRTGFWHEMALHGDERSYYNVWLTDAGDRSALDHILDNKFMFVISNASHLYLDMPYAMAADEPGLPWANYTDTEDIYRFNPVSAWNLSANDQIMGIQAQLWTETVFTGELMDYYLFPRLLAVAERAWNHRPVGECWPDFYHAIQRREMDRLLAAGLNPRHS